MTSYSLCSSHFSGIVMITPVLHVFQFILILEYNNMSQYAVFILVSHNVLFLYPYPLPSPLLSLLLLLFLFSNGSHLCLHDTHLFYNPVSLSCFFFSSCQKLDSDSIYEKANETLRSESVLFHATQWFPNLSVFLYMASFALFLYEVEQNSIRDRCHLFFITLLLIDI